MRYSKEEGKMHTIVSMTTGIKEEKNEPILTPSFFLA
jgi:hypothetical protein